LNSETVRQKNFNYRRIAVISEIVQSYDGKIPLHHFLKKYFSSHRNFGSSDRKFYASCCYAFYRLGNALNLTVFEEHLAIAVFMVYGNEKSFSSFITFLTEKNQIQFPSLPFLSKRIAWVEENFPEFSLNDIFPFQAKLSEGIDSKIFALSMLEQPLVFIRVVPGKEKLIITELAEKKISYQIETSIANCYSFSPATKLHDLDSFKNGFFEIQDRSSQIAGAAIPAADHESWWDCCCGSGGKAIQLLQSHTNIKLTASDIRESILQNFAARLEKINAGKVRLIELDLETDEPPIEKFNGIIVDAPCSGSGTWSRTPERLTFFKETELVAYTQRQKTILSKVHNALEPGGRLIYITCSVFASENEDIVKWLIPQGLTLIHQKTEPGYLHNSDSMFYAVFTKP
jgi:16S rRNA (cytosine967-C5)-methyltransferase